ncbi:hypothetical protein NHP21005_09170 [Helicobacter sp. NHP21005]|uniref:hypothetical protein n=1 Tax=Helicobacter felistomachi TaxID=3040201 RepID=UPI002572F0A5|nr:hypothetical protein [Helicobacter sp. NHP21005]BEG57229.1 hypothetical protein NHP21005_09170 [Helicobacter sp. NHP21005]
MLAVPTCDTHEHFVYLFDNMQELQKWINKHTTPIPTSKILHNRRLNQTPHPSTHKAILEPSTA